MGKNTTHVCRLVVGPFAFVGFRSFFFLERRMVHHGHDGYRHVGPHYVRVRHSQKQHEGDEMPSAEKS